jgi:hypothetical protein
MALSRSAMVPAAALSAVTLAFMRLDFGARFDGFRTGEV